MPNRLRAITVLFAAARAWLVAPIRQDEKRPRATVAKRHRTGTFDGQGPALAAPGGQATAPQDTAHLFDGERSERVRADQIIEMLADGLLTLDAGGRVEMVNLAAEGLTGWSAGRAAGRPVCEVLGCASRDRCESTCRLISAQRDGQRLHDERWLTQMPEGTARVLSLSAAPLPPTDSGPGGLVVFLRDATGTDEMERFQRELVAAISHEIRAPLANIDVTVDQLLSLGAGDGFTGGLETIRAQSRRLGEFAARMLDVSRIDSGDWQPEGRPLPVSLLVDEIAREWQDSQPERIIAIEMPNDRLWAWADEQAVGNVLNDLLSNAVKYSAVGTGITVSAMRGPVGSITVAVADHGAGIPAEKQALIFDRFYRADARDNQQAYGMGLGLYTARRRIELMGGRIGVTSQTGRGSRFAFTLPALDSTAGRTGWTKGDV